MTQREMTETVHPAVTTATPLAVIIPRVGGLSETFLRRHAMDLLPGRTVVYSGGVWEPCRWKPENLALFGELPAPWLRRKMSGIGVGPHWQERALAEDLRRRGVQAVIGEYLDYSHRWLGACAQAGVRYFPHAHGYDVSVNLRDAEWRRKYLDLSSATGVVTMSEHSKGLLVELGLEANRIHVVPYGVDVPGSPCTPARAGRLRCIAVGRMVPKKSPLDLLRSFRKAHEALGGDLELDIVGDGPLLDDAKSFVREAGLVANVRLHGGQPSPFVQNLLRSANVFLQHSRVDPGSGDTEGLPVAIIEAMALGLPVVSTRHAGIPEEVAEGESGFLVDEGDWAGMAEAIVRLGEDESLRRRIGLAAHARALERFSWRRERDTLLEVLGLNGGVR
ncbi:glycosyltransferase family 4 protein [Candidatus Poribacteria bacterium]|nr:glycosyltransferase family 4 protein [Candidatus Poribacteria bacterium]